MISIIIPYMPVEPYNDYLPKCIELIKAQTIESEIIISEHAPEKWIRLNYLLNKGIKKAKYNFLFFCNVDFFLEDKTILERLCEKLKEYDVIFTTFWSHAKNQYKFSDGGVCTKRKVIEKFGYFDEDLKGISRATFIFIDWCLKNTNWYWGKEFEFKLAGHPSPKSGKIHYPTLEKCKPIQKKVNQIIYHLP